MTSLQIRNDAKLDFVFDWASKTNRQTLIHDWLGEGETISSFIIEVSPNSLLSVVTSSTLSDGNTSVTVWIDTAGVTVDTEFTVLCSIVTSAGRKDSRNLHLTVVDKWVA